MYVAESSANIYDGDKRDKRGISDFIRIIFLLFLSTVYYLIRVFYFILFCFPSLFPSLFCIIPMFSLFLRLYSSFSSLSFPFNSYVAFINA
jgi:hypothetical protein